MENKYYTPAIEEFHVGFEYEWKNEDGNWIKENSPTEITVEGYDEQTYGLKVKYLDKEDIESLGFKQITNDCYNLPVKEFRGMLDQEVRILVKDTILIYLAQKLNESNTHVLFTGYIKNKSELKIILKQLNINEKSDQV
jgi:hypothetical protein